MSVPSSVRGPVLFVSNGNGEDAIACGIVRALRRRAPGVRVLALPLVGEGRAYEREGVEVVGPRGAMPSGGLLMAGWSQVLRDLRAGLLGLTLGHIAAIRRLTPSIAAYVAVGDAYPALLGALFARQRVLLVGTARSDWFVPYAWAERLLFRLACDEVLARDEPTAATLRRHGVPARWVGNAMMDDLEGSGVPLPLPPGVPALGLLPGSREVAYADFPVLLEAVRHLGAQRNLAWVAALADATEVDRLLQVAGPGWVLVRDEVAGEGVEGTLRGAGQDILLVRGRFADVLQAVTLVIGQAGTGNEQAVGLGRPVVSFDSEGRATPGWYRARQIGLLGEAMQVVPRAGEALAAAAGAILDDPARLAAMQRVGAERMGPPGACAAMAGAILERMVAAQHADRLQEHVQRTRRPAGSFGMEKEG